jgi:MFS transporter, CP family, cyanate transporter
VTDSTRRVHGNLARPASRVLLTVTVIVTALNLRPVVASVGPVLRELQADLGMSDSLAGVLTSLPLLCFGIVGLLSGRIGRRLPTETVMVGASTLVLGGLVIRAAVGSAWLFLLASFVALVGVAVTNVMLPVAVRRWFPDRLSSVTGIYSMALTLGAAIGAALAVPIGVVLGGWRGAVGAWSALAAATVVLWVVAVRNVASRPLHPEAPGMVLTSRSVHRNPRAWALAVYLGLQALEAFTILGWLPAILGDAGIDPARAGLMVSVTMVIAAPVSLLLPFVIARSPDQRILVVVLLVAALLAYLGLIHAPTAAPWVWVSLSGLGMSAFPLALFMIGLRAATARGTAELSSLAQGFGFLIATLGPLAVGILHERTGGWTVPLWLLVALLVPKLFTGLVAGTPGYVDQQSTAPSSSNGS